jgi:fucose permease
MSGSEAQPPSSTTRTQEIVSTDTTVTPSSRSSTPGNALRTTTSKQLAAEVEKGLSEGLSSYDKPTNTSSNHRLRANLQFATCLWAYVLAGWNDGTTGPLLPRIQEVYHVGIMHLMSFPCHTVLPAYRLILRSSR